MWGCVCVCKCACVRALNALISIKVLTHTHTHWLTHTHLVARLLRLELHVQIWYRFALHNKTKMWAGGTHTLTMYSLVIHEQHRGGLKLAFSAWHGTRTQCELLPQKRQHISFIQSQSLFVHTQALVHQGWQNSCPGHGKRIWVCKENYKNKFKIWRKI